MCERFDYLVLGSGIGGLSVALKLAQLGTVCVVTKKNRAESNTNYAQGGIACVTSREDSFDAHVRDTLEAGGGLCREEIVRACVADGPARVRELIDLGIRFSERDGRKGEWDLGREGGHTKRRVLHAQDMTGYEIERGLLVAAEAHPNIVIRENMVAADLITSRKTRKANGNRCLGVYIFDKQTRKMGAFAARAIVLATGGSGKCYVYTTNPDIATGDGVAMAYRAGAAVANLEFVQFHPTCLYHPLSKSFLISEALRGEGGKLIDAQGEDVAFRYDPRGAMAPRDIVARAIDAEMKRSGDVCVYLDMTHKDRDFLAQRFPNIYKHCAELGIDMAVTPIPVVPAAHYQCGGVVTDLNGDTGLPGLLAVGEAACTGLHGANRLASNSLLEAVVVAHRAAQLAAEQGRAWEPAHDLPPWQEGDALDPDEAVVVSHNWREIRQLMWDYVGIVRSTKRLRRALNRLEILEREIREYYWNFKITADLLELRNLCLVSKLIVQCALERKESRGLHYTIDYPQTSAEARDTVFRRFPNGS